MVMQHFMATIFILMKMKMKQIIYIFFQFLIEWVNKVHANAKPMLQL